MCLPHLQFPSSFCTFYCDLITSSHCMQDLLACFACHQQVNRGHECAPKRPCFQPWVLRMQVQPPVDMTPLVLDQQPAAAAAAPSSTAHEATSSARHDDSSGAGPSSASLAVDSSQAGPSMQLTHHPRRDDSSAAGPSLTR